MLFRMRTLITKEFIQLFRDRLLAPFVLFGPLAELLMIAWSTSQGIDHLPTAVLDMDRTNASRGLVIAMENAETFEPYYVESLDQVTDDVDHGRALAAWVIPAGFQAQMTSAVAQPPQLQLIVDGADVRSRRPVEDLGHKNDANLSQIKSIAESHGGHFDLQSSRWEGTEVSLELPGKILLAREPENIAAEEAAAVNLALAS